MICGASPASCAVAHSTWRSYPGRKAAGARSLPSSIARCREHVDQWHHHLICWQRLLLFDHEDSFPCSACSVSLLWFILSELLFGCFCLVLPIKPCINIPITLPSRFQAIKRMNVLCYCNGLSTATCGTHGTDENFILRFGGNTCRKELLKKILAQMAG